MSLDRSLLHAKITHAALGISLVSLPFSIPICHAGIFLLFANWLSSGHWQEKWSLLRKNREWLFFFSFTIWVLLRYFTAENHSIALFALEKKFTWFIIPVILASTKPLSARSLSNLLLLFVSTCLVASLICVGVASYHALNVTHMDITSNFDPNTNQQYHLLHPDASPIWHLFSYSSLAGGIGMHPTYFALYLALCILLIIAHTFEQDSTWGSHLQKWRLPVASFLTCFTALLSSRVIVVALICLFFIFGISQVVSSNHSETKTYGLSGVVVVLLLLVTFCNPVSVYRLINEPQHSDYSIEPNTIYTHSTDIRLSLWFTSLEAIHSIDIISGAGLGEVSSEMHKASAQLGISNILGSADPHNQFLNTMIELGVVGVLLLTGVIFFPLFSHPQQRPMIHIGFIFLIFVVSITESVFEAQKGIVFFVLFQSLFSFHWKNDDIIKPSVK